jgi:hypothetical protein
MIEIVVKDNELQIYINRKKLAEWLAGKGDVPWDGDPNSEDDTGSPEERERKAEEKQAEVDKLAENLRKEHESQGYTTADGERKELPNDADGRDKAASDDDTKEKPVDGIDLFEEGPTGQKGTIQDAPQGKKKLKELRDWIKAENFNYRNFCLYLHSMTEVAGFKLSTPLIGVTKQKQEPTLLQVAFRFYSYWLSAKEEIATNYKEFLLRQLDDMGVKIKMVEEILEGEEIDPLNLPKGFEV